MPKITSYTLFSAVILGVAVHVRGESSLWSQCGGVNWTGSITCVSGSVCSKINDYYSQCIPNSNATASTSPTVLPNLPTTSSSSSSSPSGSSTPGLHKIALTSSRYFGCATDNGELKDSSYTQILQNSNEFGVITPGNSMKWDATEKSRGVFNFSGGDAVVKFAEGNKQKIRGHCLVWHSQLPNWVSNGGFDKATLTSIIQNHVTQLVTKWKGHIFHWDVVNEPFNEDGTLRTSVFYKTLGEEFISIALRAARAADPSAKLYINDYNIDGTSSKSTAMYNLISRLKAAKVPLDGVGVQAHLIAGSVPSTFKSNLARFAELGVEVAVTELDIRMKMPATSEMLVQQAKDYKMVAESCNAVDKCVGITIWDYTDKYSWVPSVFPGQGAALPWDENFAKKPAYAAIAAGLA